MSTPFRLRALESLTEVIERVTPDNGYVNDLKGRVFRGRLVYGEDDPIPMVTIVEPPIPLETIYSRGANRNSSGEWELLIQGFVRDDHENPSDPAHILMAEVKAEIVKEKRRERGKNILGLGFGRSQASSVVDMHIGQGSVRPADEVSAFTFFWLSLTLQLAENLEDPYA